MKKYLVIQNDGLIVEEDLYLIGSSTKRGENKIGMFGSGWKYALAYLFRSDIAPKIYSGNKEILLDFEVVLHRDTPTKVITINDKRTSITTEMGHKWQCWMALREIISNAIDEGNFQMETSIGVEPKGINDSSTSVWIPINNEITNILLKYDLYFCFERVPSHGSEFGEFYINEKKEIETIYRKGIRCNEIDNDRKSRIQYNFFDLEVDENRIAPETNIRKAKSDLLYNSLNLEILEILLKENDYTLFNYVSLSKETTELLMFLKEKYEYNFFSDTNERLLGIFGMPNNPLKIPEIWYSELLQRGLINSPFEEFGGNDNYIPSNVEINDTLHNRLKLFNIDVEVVLVTFINEYMKTLYSREDNTIYLSIDLYKRSSDYSDVVYKIINSLPESYFRNKIRKDENSK